MRLHAYACTPLHTHACRTPTQTERGRQSGDAPRRPPWVIAHGENRGDCRRREPEFPPRADAEAQAGAWAPYGLPQDPGTVSTQDPYQDPGEV